MPANEFPVGNRRREIPRGRTRKQYHVQIGDGAERRDVTPVSRNLRWDCIAPEVPPDAGNLKRIEKKSRHRASEATASFANWARRMLGINCSLSRTRGIKANAFSRGKAERITKPAFPSRSRTCCSCFLSDSVHFSTGHSESCASWKPKAGARLARAASMFEAPMQTSEAPAKFDITSSPAYLQPRERLVGHFIRRSAGGDAGHGFPQWAVGPWQTHAEHKKMLPSR